MMKAAGRASSVAHGQWRDSMALMRTSNPALNERQFRGGGNMGGYPMQLGETMTLNGTVNKTGILLVCAMATAYWTWEQFLATGNPASVSGWMMLGLIGGLVLAMVTIFKKEWAGVTAPAYALCEGLVLGGLSAMFEARWPGIAIEAVSLTFGVLFVLLFAYRSRLIRVTQKMRLGIVAATGAVMLFYLAQMVLGFFHVRFTTLNGSGPLSIGISLVIVGIAAMNLVLDFDMIETGVRVGAPKYMEWYGAFGLMVTLVWLYMEMLSLLSKLNSRR